MVKYNILLLSLLFGSALLGQRLEGHITNTEGEVLQATVMIPPLGRVAVTDVRGLYSLGDLPVGCHEVLIKSMGYKTERIQVCIKSGSTEHIEVAMENDPLQLDEVVVSGTRSSIPAYEAPVMVHRISARTFELTQSLSLAEGLNFSPGLRVENNCQNCGFTQVRMNGLEGAYTQILINSRPVFSALAGVYGLEMLPSSMIDRIEVVRGGGSVLYGGNAIGGTINIITKDPSVNSIELGLNQALTNLEASDRSTSLKGSIVADDGQKGIGFFAFQRSRDHWDANGDQISEITALENLSFGMDGFLQIKPRSKLKFKFFNTKEERRGGSDFGLEPHQAAIAEALAHNITSANASLEYYTKDYRHKFSVYAAAQWIHRDSYYGSGGRVILPNDSITPVDLRALNAYGKANDISATVGLQHSFEINQDLHLTSGSEMQVNNVTDRMPGYRREIDQKVRTLGTYSQLQFLVNKKLTLLAGGRVDLIDIDGQSQLGDFQGLNNRRMWVAVPRLTAMYGIDEHLKVRLNYAQGYRAPQAFDEDLHIGLVGGDALFVQFGEDLQTEQSQSYTASIQFQRSKNQRQVQLVAEYFYTQLSNPFILAEQETLDDGISIITKRNGSAAFVSGMNFEANFSLNTNWLLQSGFTVQSARYAQDEVIWKPHDDAQIDAVLTRNVLRTPDTYGFLTLNFKPNEDWNFSTSTLYTGSMKVPHVINPENGFTVIKDSPNFIEVNAKIAWIPRFIPDSPLELSTGFYNIFDSYQNDFDLGVDRDANYVYGPMRPRTLFFSLSYRI